MKDKTPVAIAVATGDKLGESQLLETSLDGGQASTRKAVVKSALLGRACWEVRHARTSEAPRDAAPSAVVEISEGLRLDRPIARRGDEGAGAQQDQPNGAGAFSPEIPE